MDRLQRAGLEPVPGGGAVRTWFLDLDGVMPTSIAPSLRGSGSAPMKWPTTKCGYTSTHTLRSSATGLPARGFGVLRPHRAAELSDPHCPPKINYPRVAAQKRGWVREHVSSTARVLPVMGGRHKPLFRHQPGDVLIDDHPGNCAAWEKAGGVPILHSNQDFLKARDQASRLKHEEAHAQPLRTQRSVACAAENEHAE